jgi:hypothetical protein
MYKKKKKPERTNEKENTEPQTEELIPKNLKRSVEVVTDAQSNSEEIPTKKRYLIEQSLKAKYLLEDFDVEGNNRLSTFSVPLTSFSLLSSQIFGNSTRESHPWFHPRFSDGNRKNSRQISRNENEGLLFNFSSSIEYQKNKSTSRNS